LLNQKDDNGQSLFQMTKARKVLGLKNVSVSHKRKRDSDDAEAEDLGKSWRQVLGNPPPRSQVRDWIKFQKLKWAWQAKQKKHARYKITWLLF